MEKYKCFNEEMALLPSLFCFFGHFFFSIALTLVLVLVPAAASYDHRHERDTGISVEVTGIIDVLT
jgi:hypothetical protein